MSWRSCSCSHYQIHKSVAFASRPSYSNLTIVFEFRSANAPSRKMYLVHTSTITLHEFVGTNIPDYAILSHRWETEEIPYRNLRDGAVDGLGAYSEVLRCCSQAAQDGWHYVWIDTC